MPVLLAVPDRASSSVPLVGKAETPATVAAARTRRELKETMIVTDELEDDGPCKERFVSLLCARQSWYK